jgi:hypothetical protein
MIGNFAVAKRRYKPIPGDGEFGLGAAGGRPPMELLTISPG